MNTDHPKTTRHLMRFSHHGFTLLELMIVVAISGILVAITLPSYMGYEAHAQRNRGEVALLRLAARMESYYTENSSYKNATAQNLHIENVTQGLQYQLAITSVSDAHYEISALPIGSQASRDRHCGTLSLTDTNIRKISGDGSIQQCWM